LRSIAAYWWGIPVANNTDPYPRVVSAVLGSYNWQPVSFHLDPSTLFQDISIIEIISEGDNLPYGALFPDRCNVMENAVNCIIFSSLFPYVKRYNFQHLASNFINSIGCMNYITPQDVCASLRYTCSIGCLATTSWPYRRNDSGEILTSSFMVETSPFHRSIDERFPNPNLNWTDEKAA